jgi:hypothetical protein
MRKTGIKKWQVQFVVEFIEFKRRSQTRIKKWVRVVSHRRASALNADALLLFEIRFNMWYHRVSDGQLIN